MNIFSNEETGWFESRNGMKGLLSGTITPQHHTDDP